MTQFLLALLYPPTTTRVLELIDMHAYYSGHAGETPTVYHANFFNFTLSVCILFYFSQTTKYRLSRPQFQSYEARLPPEVINYDWKNRSLFMY